MTIVTEVTSKDPPKPVVLSGAAPVVRRLGTREYMPVWRDMQAFTTDRTRDAPDELWVVEHPPVYTLGIAARAAHLPRYENAIPIVRSDRGGQITYHGPGQVVVYTLVDLRRLGLGVRALVRRLEHAVIELLRDRDVQAAGREDAPGVYVGEAKVAALGLRIRNGCAYHGLSLNVDMDLSPFEAIDPCGYAGLQVTSTRTLGVAGSVSSIADALLEKLAAQLLRP